MTEVYPDEGNGMCIHNQSMEQSLSLVSEPKNCFFIQAG